MAPTFGRIPPALAALCVLAGLPGPATALTTQPASMCVLNGGGSPPGATALTTEYYNGSAYLQNVVCPVVRTMPAAAGGFSVWIDGNAASGSTTCQLWSFNYNGTLLGLTSFTAAGTFDRQLTLPQSQVTTYSYQVVTCALPPYSALYDIEPVQ